MFSPPCVKPHKCFSLGSHHGNPGGRIVVEPLPPARINQVALSVSSRDTSLAFYRDVIGFCHVGGTETFRGKTTEQVQGMKGAASKVYWLMDDRPFFQLELFEFECPVGKPWARQRAPQDIGYSRIRVMVPALRRPPLPCQWGCCAGEEWCPCRADP